MKCEKDFKENNNQKDFSNGRSTHLIEKQYNKTNSITKDIKFLFSIR